MSSAVGSPGVAVDSAGNVYIGGAIGSFEGALPGGTVIFGGGFSLTCVGPSDAYVAKYNSAGAIQWALRSGGTKLDAYLDIALDGEGNVFAAGALSPDAVAPGGTGGTIVAKYDSEGNLQWAQSASGPPADPVSSLAVKVAVDSAGNALLAGWYLTSTTFGTTTLQPQDNLNFFLTRIGFDSLVSTNPPVITLQTQSQTNLVLRWPDTAAGFHLQSTLDLSATGSWSNVPVSLQTNQGFISLVVFFDDEQEFYRLVNP